MRAVYHRQENPWGRTTVIVMAGGKALAMVTVTENEREVAILHDLMVHPSKRRLGIGDALLAEAFEEAKRMGAKTLRLSVAPGSWMEGWYERSGFHLVGTNAYEGHAVDIMEKSILD